jgi:hypothetical protein
MKITGTKCYVDIEHNGKVARFWGDLCLHGFSAIANTMEWLPPDENNPVSKNHAGCSTCLDRCIINLHKASNPAGRPSRNAKRPSGFFLERVHVGDGEVQVRLRKKHGWQFVRRGKERMGCPIMHVRPVTKHRLAGF